MNVRSAMTPDPVCCTRPSSLQAVARLMIDHDCGEIPVIDDDHRPLGVITDRDIVIRAVAQGAEPTQAAVGDYMTSPVITVHPEDSLKQCCEVMEKHQVRRVLVVDKDERICGIVALADVAKNATGSKSGEVLKEVSQP